MRCVAGGNEADVRVRKEKGRRYSVKNERLDDEQQKHLAQDLLKLKSDEGFGSDFELKLIDKDTINPFWLYIRCGDRTYQAKVTFEGYPSEVFPGVMFKGGWFPGTYEDDLGSTISAEGKFYFSSEQVSGPFRLSQVVEIVLHFFRFVEAKEKCLDVSVAGVDEKVGHVFLPVLLNAGKGFLRLIGAGWGKSRARVCRLYLESNIRHDTHEVESGIPTREGMVKSAPWDIELSRIVIFEEIMRQIQKDAYFNAPNEICFLASGVLTPEGNVVVCQYYGGEMDENSQCSCSLDKKFTEKIIYEAIPEDHKVIIWGHVHPIEGPSSLDCASLRELGEWDDLLRGEGPISKRSLVMLINAWTFSVMFYDVKTERKLPHIITRGFGKRTETGEYYGKPLGAI